jgi:hypothetical protein
VCVLVLSVVLALLEKVKLTVVNTQHLSYGIGSANFNTLSRLSQDLAACLSGVERKNSSLTCTNILLILHFKL